MLDQFVTPENLIEGLDTSELVSLDDFLNNRSAWLEANSHLGRSDPNDYSKDAGHLIHRILRDIDGLPFENQVVVDLGAGQKSYGYQIAKILGAKSYVAVEPFFADDLAKSLESRENDTLGLLDLVLGVSTFLGQHYRVLHREWSRPEIPKSIVPEGMLGFLKRVPDNSVSIICSGIDKTILKVEGDIARVAREIARVVHKDGTLLKSGSDVDAPPPLKWVLGSSDFEDFKDYRSSDRSALYIRD